MVKNVHTMLSYSNKLMYMYMPNFFFIPISKSKGNHPQTQILGYFGYFYIEVKVQGHESTRHILPVMTSKWY